MNGVDTLNAMIAIAMDGAATLTKGADFVNDPRIKSLLIELAAEREAVVAELQREVRGLGGTPEDRGTVVGSAHRLYTEVKLALAPHDRCALIYEIKRSEERVREKLQTLLAEDKSLPQAVRDVIERQFEGVRTSCARVNQLEFDSKDRAESARPASRRRSNPPRPRAMRTKEDMGIMTGKQRNEGEGNKTAAKEYNEATTKFAHSGKVDKQAEAAAQAREGTERKDLDRAEQAGKSHAKGEDPQVSRQRETAKTE
jgi:uncharacterized protein (TIGR02284 family)